MKKIIVFAASLLAIGGIAFASADCSSLQVYYLGLDSRMLNAKAEALDKYNKCVNDENDAVAAKAKADAEAQAALLDALKKQDVKVTVDVALTGSISTGVVTTGNIEKNDTDELTLSIGWMFEFGLTKYSTPSKFLPESSITREQASKFFAEFATSILKKKPDNSLTCSFKDSASIDTTLQSSVKTACQLGLFKGSNGYFNPQTPITTAQIITVAMRLAYGSMDESSAQRWTNYQDKAESIGLTTSLGLDVSDLSNATRGNTAVILFRLSQQSK